MLQLEMRAIGKIAPIGRQKLRLLRRRCSHWQAQYGSSAHRWPMVRLQIPPRCGPGRQDHQKAWPSAPVAVRVTWDAAGKSGASACPLPWLYPRVIPGGHFGVSIAFDSQFGRNYRVAYKDTVAQTNWIVLHDITATAWKTSFRIPTRSPDGSDSTWSLAN